MDLAQRKSDIFSMTFDQLTDELLRLKKEQLSLRFQKASQRLGSPSKIKFVRRDIARIKTALTRFRLKAQQDRV